MHDRTAQLSVEVIADVKARLVASDWRGALDRCKRSLASFPTHGFLLSSAHKAAVQLGELSEARQYIELALATSPGVAAYHLLSGRLHQKQNELDAALRCYERAAELAPEVASHRAMIGSVHYAEERYREALVHYQAALELDAAQAAWWNRLGRCATLACELPRAVEAYTRSLELKDDYVVRAALKEVRLRLEGGAAQTGEASSSYYDAIYVDSPKYAQHGSQSIYTSVWRRIVDLLAAAGTRRVLDLGCGPGQFAEFLREHAGGIDYTGIDFSEVAIEQARVRCPGYRFKVVSLQQADDVRGLDYDTAICTEVLEHVERDVALIESLPAGRYFVATVPNYDSYGHLRHFKSAGEVAGRYGHSLSDMAVIPVALSPTSTIWLFHGRTIAEAGRGAASRG